MLPCESHGSTSVLKVGGGPDGTLYLLEFGSTWGSNPDSRLARVEYYSDNRPPVARASARGNAGRAPLTVALSSAGTSDRDGDAVRYEWRLAGDGTLLSREPDPSVVFEREGAFTVELVARDGAGLEGRARVPVLVGNDPPEVRFLAPLEGGFFDGDEPLPFVIQALDHEDGDTEDGAVEMLERVRVSGDFQPGRVATGEGERTLAPALASLKRHDCLNCHALEGALVGPSFAAIAERYANDPEAAGLAVTRVLNGSSEVWRAVPMLPHPGLQRAEAQRMVDWILDAEMRATLDVVAGRVRGALTPRAGERSGTFALRATYSDAGAAGLPPLSASAEVSLRTRRVEAEHLAPRRGTAVFDAASADGGHYVGRIDHRDELVLERVRLEGVGRVVCRVAADRIGGVIAVHAGPPRGAPLALLTVPTRGDWEGWFEVGAAIEPPAGLVDVHIVFLNRERPDSLLNLDWLRFEAEPQNAPRSR